MTARLLSLLAVVVLTTVARAADFTAADLTLGLDGALNVTALRVGQTALPVIPAPLVTLWASDTGKTASPAVAGGSLARGLSVGFADARAKADLRLSERSGALHFSCVVTGEEGSDRGMLLRFSLPFDANGWRWHDDMQTAATIGGGKLYENTVPLRAYADLPEWRDKPALRMGYSNRNFCTAVTGPVGVALAVPLDRPCLFRTAYDDANKRLEIVFDFALSGATRMPYQADFAFDLYSCDPAWGMRSALQRYYAMYPDMFKVYVARQGQWMAFNRLSEIDNANEFGFGLQEGAPEPEYDDKLDVLSTTYYTHAGMPANLPKPYDPEKDPLPPYEEQVKAVNGAFASAMGQQGIYDLVGTRKPDQKLAVEKWSVYAHLIAQFNPDPDLPYGAWMVKRTIEVTESVKARRGGNLDGFYYDGLTTGLNYARDHFRVADSPLLWDPVHKQPFLNNFFSSIEFARATADLLRPRGQITMMNGGLGESFYVVPWLDILGAETGLIIPRSDFNFVRASLHHKPFLTLLKGNYEQKIARPEMELFMKRCLFYGVYPGFFDWPPSGLGPGGQYWNHPLYYERDRDIFRKYQPLCHSLATAGWEPVTYATVSDPKVYIERFGTPGSDGSGAVFLSLLNEQKYPAVVTLTVDAKGLGLKTEGLRATDLTSGSTLAPKVTPQGLTLSLNLPADGVFAIQLATPSPAARWQTSRALDTLERGAQMRQVDAGKPPLLVHWRPSGKTYEREQVGDKTNLLFRADGKSTLSMRQWVMLFQPVAQPIKLRARVAGVNFDNGGNDAKFRCRLAWVTPSYTHYEMVDFPIPSGNYDFKDLEFEIASEHALRSIELMPTFGGKAKGDLKLASLSISDANRKEYVVDPEFAEWYEPMTAELGTAVERQVTDLRAAVTELQQEAANPSAPAFRQKLTAAFRLCRQIEQAVTQAKAENAARRVLRDLETARQHLGQALLISYNLPSPAIAGPIAAAAGDTVSLEFAAPKLPGLATRTELLSRGQVVTQPKGAAIILPADAKPGEQVEVIGLLHLGKPEDGAMLRTTHTISILPPLEMTLKSDGFSAEGAARLKVWLRNNRLQPVTAMVRTNAPGQWQTPAPTPVPLKAGSEAVVDQVLLPGGAAAAGPVEVTVIATAGRESQQSRLVLLYIPPQANLVKNPGFEDGATGWGIAGEAVVDTAIFRSGKQSLRLDNPTRRDSQIHQGFSLNQKEPCAVLIQAASRAESVAGQPSHNYSLYVDIYYKDGTKLYGQTFDFKTGTTDWQLGQLYIEPPKPIGGLSVNLLLRGTTGRAWFDDVAVMEDPRRQGNIARHAKATTDSSYSGYEPSPVNDGIIIGEGLHWTKEAWASAETTADHFIELQFPQPVKVSRATVYWSLDAGVPRTSQEVQWQVFREGAWQTLQTQRTLGPQPTTELKLAQPVTADRFRLLQPAGKGPAGRANLMWVREVELFE